MTILNSFGGKRSAGSADTTPPIGELLIRIGDIVIGSRSIWAESNSRTQAYNDLNDMALERPNELIALLDELKGQMSFEYRSNEIGQGKSLAEAFEALRNK